MDYYLLHRLFAAGWRHVRVLCISVCGRFCNGGNSIAQPLYLLQVDAGDQGHGIVLQLFFDVTEKIAIVIGMFSFGFINELTGSQRSSVLALMAFFIIGLVLLFYTLAVKNKPQP